MKDSNKKKRGKEYNKLVRDKIPGIIEKNGAKPIIRIVDEDEYVYSLKKKILEEAGELNEAEGEGQELEEIIDIMEAVNAYMKHRKVSADLAEKVRKHKLRKRGGFDKRIFLERVE
ncbi:MAG: phosphoribosyl-ATP pyrophosphohydrolase [Candidatus Aenigmatarchaeota archaeon]|nr:MAG: phosphoribosyl-ATP pyrophosphohydrolase [Candidatus Aenigmarchaeota archaeon]